MLFSNTMDFDSTALEITSTHLVRLYWYYFLFSYCLNSFPRFGNVFGFFITGSCNFGIVGLELCETDARISVV